MGKMDSSLETRRHYNIKKGFSMKQTHYFLFFICLLFFSFHSNMFCERDPAFAKASAGAMPATPASNPIGQESIYPKQGQKNKQRCRERQRRGHNWRKRAFNWIYEKNHWCKDETTPLSGDGSTLKATETLRTILPSILKAINAKTFLDAGCGDFTWMKEMLNNLDIEKYIGIDIVENVIAENNSQYKNQIYEFHCADIVQDAMPKVDLIICRDCFAHLSFEDIKTTIQNFKKSGSTYLLASTVPTVAINTKDIESGNCRFVNLRAYPFHFPMPVMLFQELSATKKWLGIWRLDDIEL